MWQYTAGRPPLSQLPKPHIAIRLSSGFSHFRPGVFHISLQKHKTKHTQKERVEEKRTNKHGLRLAPSASLWHFSVSLRASTGNRRRVFERNSHKITRNADSSSHVCHPDLSAPVLAVTFLLLTIGFPRLLSTVLFCRLVCSLPWFLLLSSLEWLLLLTLGSSFPRPLPVSLEIWRTNPLCGFCAKTDKSILWLVPTPTHRETNAAHRVTRIIQKQLRTSNNLSYPFP